MAEPRHTERFKALYHLRGAVERKFGYLKNEWGLAPLRVRRIYRVRLHTDRTMLAMLATVLATARAVPLAAQLAAPASHPASTAGLRHARTRFRLSEVAS